MVLLVVITVVVLAGFGSLFFFEGKALKKNKKSWMENGEIY